jgi:hypothetical protein
VLVISAVFLLLSLPRAVVTVVSYASDMIVYGPKGDVELWLLTMFVLNCNSAVNFYIYCLTGFKFHSEFVRLVSCCRKH